MQEMLTSDFNAGSTPVSKSVMINAGEKDLPRSDAISFSLRNICLYVIVFLLTNNPNTHGKPKSESIFA